MKANDAKDPRAEEKPISVPPKGRLQRIKRALLWVASAAVSTAIVNWFKTGGFKELMQELGGHAAWHFFAERFLHGLASMIFSYDFFSVVGLTGIVVWIAIRADHEFKRRRVNGALAVACVLLLLSVVLFWVCIDRRKPLRALCAVAPLPVSVLIIRQWYGARKERAHAPPGSNAAKGTSNGPLALVPPDSQADPINEAQHANVAGDSGSHSSVAPAVDAPQTQPFVLSTGQLDGYKPRNGAGASLGMSLAMPLSMVEVKRGELGLPQRADPSPSLPLLIINHVPWGANAQVLAVEETSKSSVDVAVADPLAPANVMAMDEMPSLFSLCEDPFDLPPKPAKESTVSCTPVVTKPCVVTEAPWEEMLGRFSSCQHTLEPPPKTPRRRKHAARADQPLQPVKLDKTRHRAPRRRKMAPVLDQQPPPFTPGVTREMVHGHVSRLYPHKEKLTRHEWVSVEKHFVETTGICQR